MRRSVESYKEQTDLKKFTNEKRIIMNSRNAVGVSGGKKKQIKDKMCIKLYEKPEDWLKDVKGLNSG